MRVELEQTSAGLWVAVPARTGFNPRECVELEDPVRPLTEEEDEDA